MQHLFSNIPIILRQRPNWVAWGIRGAPLKSPFNPANLLSGKFSPAKAGVRDTWGSYQNAAECVSRGLARGIGYEFDGGDVYGIDLDHVLDETGALIPEAQEIVEGIESYAEISPGGKGLHIFVLAPGADIVCHRKKDFFLEIYNDGRYFTVTGNICGGTKTIESRTAELQEIHDKYLLPKAAQKVVSLPSQPTHSAEQDWFLRIGLERDKTFEAVYGDGNRILA